MRQRTLIVVLVTLLMACSAPFMVPPATQTAIPSIAPEPQLTLTPTLEPLMSSETVTVEATITAAPAGSTRPELDCQVLSQAIRNGARFASKERFDMSWMVQNTGSATWEPGVVDLVQVGGSKMYQYQPVLLPHSSPPGDIIWLHADMVAPRTPNKYTTIWSLRRGDEYFCRMTLTINVHL